MAGKETIVGIIKNYIGKVNRGYDGHRVWMDIETMCVQSESGLHESTILVLYGVNGNEYRK